jgi:hypothetical protein
MDQECGDMSKHRAAREKVVAFLRVNKARFAPFLDEDEMTYAEYLEELGCPGVYGDNLALVAYASAAGVDVCVHQLGQPIWIVQAEECRAAERQLHVVYYDWEHYDSVRRLDQSAGGPANVQLPQTAHPASKPPPPQPAPAKPRGKHKAAKAGASTAPQKPDTAAPAPRVEGRRTAAQALHGDADAVAPDADALPGSGSGRTLEEQAGSEDTGDSDSGMEAASAEPARDSASVGEAGTMPRHGKGKKINRRFAKQQKKIEKMRRDVARVKAEREGRSEPAAAAEAAAKATPSAPLGIEGAVATLTI